MKVVSFIEPPQVDVIEEILKHSGLWQSRSPRAHTWRASKSSSTQVGMGTMRVRSRIAP